MHKRALTIILAMAAILRLALLASAWNHPLRVQTPDSESYLALARSLVTSGTFTQGGEVELFRTPGYPLFLTLGVLLGPDGWHAIVLLQILLDLATAYLAYRLGGQLGSARAGVWAAAIFAFHPAVVASCVRILSDTLFAFLLMLALLWLVEYLRSQSWRSVAGFALVAGAGCYVRPVGLSFLEIALGVLLIRAVILRLQHKPQLPNRLPVMCLLIAAAVFPWVVRNGRLGDFWGFSSVSSKAAFDYQAPAVLARQRGISLSQARLELENRYERLAPLRPRTPGEKVRARQMCANEVVSADKGLYLWIHVRGDLAVWAPGASDLLEILGVTSGGKGTLDVFQRQGLAAAVGHYFHDASWSMWLNLPVAALQLGAFALAIVGVIYTFRPQMPAILWVMYLTVVMLAIIPGPAGHPRFLVPILPLLGLAAGAGASGRKSSSEV